jgi:hypothetical protein
VNGHEADSDDERETAEKKKKRKKKQKEKVERTPLMLEFADIFQSLEVSFVLCV